MLDYKEYVLIEGLEDRPRFISVLPHAIFAMRGDMLEVTDEANAKHIVKVLSHRIALFRDHVDWLKTQNMVVDDRFTVTARLSRIDDMEDY